MEARADKGLRTGIERGLYGLFSGEADEGATFDRLAELTDAKYPLLAYLYFLKDIDRFMPIQPTGFDRAFRALAIDFSTLRQCGWESGLHDQRTQNQTFLQIPIVSSSEWGNLRGK